MSTNSIRDIITLPLAPSTIEILLKQGFRTVGDLVDITVIDLAKECSIPIALSSLIINICKEHSGEGYISGDGHGLRIGPSAADSFEASSQSTAHDTILTAKDLLTQIGNQKPIITFCKEIDMMLGGGIAVGQITEICGVPGVSPRRPRRPSVCLETGV